jgi:hypothetical protein
MRIIKILAVIFIPILNVFNSFSQIGHLHLQPSSSTKNKIEISHYSSLLFKQETPIVKPYMNQFRYTAFFCKMELKSVDYFGIWIKVHAGNYEEYTRDMYARP